MAPLADTGLLQLVDLSTPARASEGPGLEVAPGVRLLPAPGHTPGHTAVEVTGGDRTALLVGDLVHHPLQVDDPSISTRMCVDPGTAATTRTTILDRAARTGAMVFASHVVDPFTVATRPDRSGYDLTWLN